MNHTLFRDVISLFALLMVLIVILTLPLINPPASDGDTKPMGQIVVHIFWPEGDTDVDLWVHGPGEPVPVGYSNKGGLLWNLLRDDLGHTADATKFNFENAITRGMLAGEYIINLHCYRCHKFPITVEVEVLVEMGASKTMRKVVSTSVDLMYAGQERTAIRFRLDDEGKFVDGSESRVYQPLRSGSKQ
jgi:hypothetical protein